jgi:hypothetical protein
MTWDQARLSLQLAAELRYGFVNRERQRMAREIEDATFAASKGAVEEPR